MGDVEEAGDAADEVILERVLLGVGEFIDLLGRILAVADRLLRGLGIDALRRRLIDFTLQKARSTRYRHAVRHVREIESQQSDIADYGRHESHTDYMARLKREHARKPAFWSLLAA